MTGGGEAGEPGKWTLNRSGLSPLLLHHSPHPWGQCWPIIIQLLCSKTPKADLGQAGETKSTPTKQRTTKGFRAGTNMA